MLCLTYLNELEAKLLELKHDATDSSSGHARIVEALSFVNKAVKALTEAQAQLKMLREPSPDIEPLSK